MNCSLFTLCILCTIVNLAKSEEVCQTTSRKNAVEVQWQSDKWFAENFIFTSYLFNNLIAAIQDLVSFV